MAARASIAAALALCLGPWAALAQQGYIFKWVDAKGNIHATDQLAEVPEPFYGMYAAKLRELEERKKERGQAASAPSQRPAPPPAPSAPSIVELELRKQQRWKAEVARWRASLTAAIAELESAQQALAELTMNPLLRTTPQVQAQLPQAEERVKRAREQVELARKTLIEDIPARARKESVPPKWLE